MSLSPGAIIEGAFSEEEVEHLLDAFAKRAGPLFRRWLSSLLERELRAFQTPPGRSWPAPTRPDELELLDAASGERPQPDEARHLLAIMGELSQKDRDILAMRHFEEKSFDAIAAALGVSLPTTRQLYRRALESLQRLMKESRE